MRTQSVILNLIPSGVNPVVHLSQYDQEDDGALLFNIYDGNVLADLTGCTATIEGTKPDGTFYMYPCTVYSTYLTSAVNFQMTSIAGSYPAEVRINRGAENVGTINLTMMVEPAGVGRVDVSDTEIPSLLDDIETSVDEAEYWAHVAEHAVTGVASWNGRTGAVVPVAGDYDASQVDYDNTNSGLNATTEQEAIDELAPKKIITTNDAFDPTKTYTAGEWLIHQGVLYEVITACTGVTPPNATYYEPQTIGSALEELKNIQILIRETQYVSGLRYKNLGSQPTSEQLTKLANGDFTDFWNGDYWTYGGKNYRIVDNTNYYLNKGDTAFNKPGLIIMRDDNTLKADGSTTKYMKDTNDTTGGLKATKWWTTYRSQVKSTYDAWCGSAHIGQFRDLITNAVANGHASGFEWADCTVQLPGEVQIYGSQIWGVGQDMNVNNGGLSGCNTGIAYPQFALFRLAPRWITNRENYWLKDICSPSDFAAVDSGGGATYSYASIMWVGLRPFFILV